MRVKKRFYVGASHLPYNDKWCHTYEADAIRHAEDLVEGDGQARFIVKIIKVVKPIKNTKIEEVFPDELDDAGDLEDN